MKVGGDHGKSSMKFTIEVANLAKRNAQTNAVVIAIALVKDAHTNLKRYIDRGLEGERERLVTLKWQWKQIKVFLNGD